MESDGKERSPQTGQILEDGDPGSGKKPQGAARTLGREATRRSGSSTSPNRHRMFRRFVTRGGELVEIESVVRETR